MRAILALVVLAVPVVAAPVPKAKKGEDEKNILGTWRMKEHAMDGRPDDSSDVCWRFEPDGKLFCVHTKTGREFPMGYSLDPTGDPKRMEWRPTGEKEVSPSIYKIDGDTLITVCPIGKGPRPTEFAPGKGVYYTEFRREPTTDK